MSLLSCFFLASLVNWSNGFKGTFWHITDIHLNLSNTRNSYAEDSTKYLLKSAVSYMKKIESKPDFVIWNGDNVRHMNISDKEFFSTEKNVAEILSNAFGDTLIPSLGNHDLNPSDFMGTKSKICRQLYDCWKKFIPNLDSDFKKGCYYSRLINNTNNNIRIIVLNTILWFKQNSLVKNLEDPLGQFKWFRSQLEEVERKDEKVFIMGHVPPGGAEFYPSKFVHLHDHFNEKFVNLLINYSEFIEAALFSHEHTDAFKIVYNEKNESVIPIFLSPSLSPRLIGKLGSINPSVRLYKWNSHYLQYHTVLPNALNKNFSWTLEYNSSKLYESLSAVALDKYLKGMTFSESGVSEKLELFLQYHLSGRPHESNCSVSAHCCCRVLCGLRFLLHNNIINCLSKCNITKHKTSTDYYININDNSTDSSNTKPMNSNMQILLIATIIVVFTAVLIAVVCWVNKHYCKRRHSASLTRDIYMASYKGQSTNDVMEEHIENIAESTFGDVPEYRGHIRQNSRTLLHPKDVLDDKEKTAPNSNITKLILNSKGNNKIHEKYDYQRM